MTATHLHAHPTFVGLVVMWLGMMTAMMAPVVWPWLRAYSAMASPGATGARSRIVTTTPFAGGYLAAWLGYSIAAASIQLALGAADRAIGSPAWRAALLFVAGAYQFAPLKRACLAHCRNPLSYFLTRWRGGPAGGFRMGLGHGVHCVGCCWALMLIALAVGVMNLWWMAALAAVAFVEQVVPRGDLLRLPLGAALVVGGLLPWIA